MDETKTNTELVPLADARFEPGLPPVLAGRATPAVERQVGSFYASVAEVFERWVARRDSKHTRRAYRQDVMAFVAALGIRWPEDAMRLFTVSVADVQAFRDRMIAAGQAPKTINRRIASLSSFYKYLQGVASEFRLPITVPEPGARPVHPPRLVRPARRDEGPLGHPGPPAHGAAGRRYGPRLSGPRDHQGLPLQRDPDRDRLPAEGEGLPPGRRRGDDHAAREGRQAPPHRAPLRRGPGDRRVHREGGADEGPAVPGPAGIPGRWSWARRRSAW